MKLLSTLLACGATLAVGSAVAAQQDKVPYVVGAVVSLSGPGAVSGRPQRDALFMVRDEVNRQGGVNGHPLVVVVEDDASDNTTAVRAVKKLIDQDNVAVLIGATGTGATLAMLPVVEASGLALLSPAAGAAITNPLRPWIFRTQLTEQVAAEKLVATLVREHLERVALLYEAGADGLDARDQFKAAAARNRVQVVSEQSVPVTATDVTSQLRSVTGVDAVVGLAGPSAGAAIARGVRATRLLVPLYLGHLAASSAFITGAGPAAGVPGVVGGKLLVAAELKQSDPQRKVLLEFTGDFQARYHVAPEGTRTAGVYDALQLVIQALAKVGNERVALRNGLEKTRNFIGVLGVYNYSPTSHDPGGDSMALMQVDGGAWKILVGRPPALLPLPPR